MYRMRVVRSLVAVVLAMLVLATPAVVLADGRVALVVGNSTYAHIGRLPSPDNDAADMSAALRRLGFEVTTELDADRVELTEALRAFTRRSAGADVSLVFYAGHGIEMDGVNYLVPVDARLERDVDVRFETVTVDDLLVSTSGTALRLRLVILDACRNNPLARSMQRTAATRTVSGGSFADLNEDLRGDETLVAYAAAAGTTAADGRGRNSPYTAALLLHLETPLEFGLLFRRVRAQVLAATNGAERPHEYHSLVGEHYLTRTLATGASTTVSTAIPADPAPAAPLRPDPPETDIPELHVTALRTKRANTSGITPSDTLRGQRRRSASRHRRPLHHAFDASRSPYMPLAQAPWVVDEEEPHPLLSRSLSPALEYPGGGPLDRHCLLPGNGPATVWAVAPARDPVAEERNREYSPESGGGQMFKHRKALIWAPVASLMVAGAALAGQEVAVEGRVVIDETESRPAQSITVQYQELGDGDHAPVSRRTDNDGKFRFEFPRDSDIGKYGLISVRARGYTPALLAWPVPIDTRVVLRLSRPVEIHGTIVNTSRLPVRGTRLKWSTEHDGRWATGMATAHQDGYFHLHVPNTNDLRIAAWADYYAPTAVAYSPADQDPPPTILRTLESLVDRDRSDDDRYLQDWIGEILAARDSEEPSAR